MDLKRICVPLVVLGAVGAVSLTGCPDKTPGKETIKNTWQDMLDQLSKMDEASMKKHWKRYYQKAIEDLQARCKKLQDKKVDLMTEEEMKGKEVAQLQAKAKKAKTLIMRSIAKYKEQKTEDPNRTTFNIDLQNPNQNFSDSEAKQRLRSWTEEYKRKYSKDRLQSKAMLVKQLKANTERIDIAIDAYKNKIQMLKDQMDAYEAKLETAKLKESMRALAESGNELDSEQGIPKLAQLAKLNKSLDKAIVKEDIRSKLAADEKNLASKKESLDEAMKATPDTAGANVSDLEKELKGL